MLRRQGESECLADWINPIYLSMATQAEIQQQFVDDSEIKLCDFLLPDKHELLTDSLRTLQKSPTSGAKVLESVSFPNRQVYERIPHHLLLPQDGARESHDATDHSPGRREEEEEKAPEQQGKRSALNAVRSLVTLFQSEEMFLYLSNLSGLSLHPLASDSDDDESEAKKQKLDDVTAAEDVIASTNQSNSARCSCQVRRWREGFYTLLRDNGGEGKFALDINLYVGPQEEWREEYGGCTIYVADNEAEELLTILPTDNCLSMVYRDVSASKFVKYLNHKSRDREFFDLSLAYYE